LERCGPGKLIANPKALSSSGRPQSTTSTTPLLHVQHLERERTVLAAAPERVEPVVRERTPASRDVDM
jgi:hypothetical protein